MSALLAQSSTESAGYALGTLVGLCVIVGIIALGTVCVVKAFTRRTTGWIVAGVFGGAIACLFLIGFAVGVARGIQRAGSAEEESAEEDAASQLPAGSSPRLPATELVRGRDIAYSIRVPVTWATKRGDDDFDTLSSFKSLYVGVIAEEANFGSPETIAKIARQGIKEKGAEIKWSEPAPLTIDGRSWLEFSIDCKLENVPFSYQFFVYSGPEGTFQIIGWTAQNLFERDVSQLREVMQSFRFPE